MKNRAAKEEQEQEGGEGGGDGDCEGLLERAHQELLC